MMADHEQTFKLMRCTESITFSIFDNKLLFIHSPFTSSQIKLDGMGVAVDNERSQAKVGFWFAGGENYISFYFCPSEYKHLRKYFMALGYPCPEISVVGAKND